MTKSKGLRGFITIILVAVLLIVAYSAFSNMNRGEVITRSEFYQMLKNDKVSSVYITGSTARVRKVGSQITEAQFKSSNAADYVFEIEAGAEISTVTDWIDLYNEGKLERNVLDGDGKIILLRH